MSRWVARWSWAFPRLALGWREIFVPLAIIVHSQHGQTLATAGLAVAAVHTGSWLRERYGVGTGQPLARPAVLAALSLAVLALVPEEGPLSLLLWAAFGLAWPLLQETLDAVETLPNGSIWWLTLGMALAGPMAVGPGALVMAAAYGGWAWLARRADVRVAAPALPATPLTGNRGQWLLALLTVATTAWMWLAPARLLDGGLPVIASGVALALAWLPRWFVGPCRPAAWPRWSRVALALLLALATAGLAAVSAPWQIVLVLAGQGLLAGLLAAQLGVGAWQPADLSPHAFAAAAGPVIGVAAFVLAGPMAPFAGGALAALLLAAGLARREGPLQPAV